MKQIDNLLAFCTGLFGGSIKFLLVVNPNYPPTLLQAAITALICGAAGYIGKSCIVFLIQKFKINKHEED